jgi:hypothetical protein
MCSELDRWYKYVKENKGGKKNTCQSALVLAKKISICLYIKRIIHKNHQPRFKDLRRRCRQHQKIEKNLQHIIQEMVFKRKNKVEEGGALGSRLKRE